MRSIVCLRELVFLASLTVAAMLFSPLAEAASTFSLRISPAEGNREQLLLLPVVVTMQLNNETDASRTIGRGGFGLADPDGTTMSPRYAFVIETPDGTTKTANLSDWTVWARYLSGGNLTESLEPGRDEILDYCLGYGICRTMREVAERKGLYRYAAPLFPDTGEYRVRLILPRLGAAGLQSATITIRISLPQTAADIKAHDILSKSPVPEILLIPPTRTVIGGMSPLSWDRSRHLGGKEFHAIQRRAVETCREIVDRCPESAYAPYARLYWATAMSDGRVEHLVDGKPGGSHIVDVERRTESIGLLRQCAEDPALPRRYRATALENLATVVHELDKYLQGKAKDEVPPVESLVGEGVVLQRLSSLSYYRAAADLYRGTDRAGISERRLRRRFTPEQIETLKTAVATNATIQTALGISPLQLEIQGHATWVLDELRKIPWHDPVTGQSRMNTALRPGALR